MRLVIVGSSSSFDNEICLIKELQARKIDFRFYFRIRSKTSPLFRIIKNYPNGIIPAKRIEELKAYEYYINLDNIYIISGIGLRFGNPKTIWLYIKVLSSIHNYNPDVIHFTWPQTRTPALLYFLRKKIVMTVHDPLPHSSHKDKVIERYRNLGFKRADSLILLNKHMTKEFCERYAIKESKIRYSKLGVFDYLDSYPAPKCDVKEKYILFFGQIASYKGLEYLLPAMVEVHKSHPEWKLIVAGGGKMYFDITEYEKLEYIEIRNHFIDMPELVSLLRNCEFAVAPYKDATQSGLLLNAFSLNKPMVVTNVGNFPDMVKDGMTGFVVPPCEVTPLVNAMNKLIENPEILMTMSTNIKHQWREDMRWDRIVDGIMDIYVDSLSIKNSMPNHIGRKK